MLPYQYRLHAIAYRYDHSFQDLRRSDGEPVKDLNHVLRISTDSYEEEC
jgi:hypothetical protein